MINEQTVGAVRHASVPSQRIKTHEQAELDALTAEFLARGGKITQTKGNQLDKKTEFVQRNNWEALPSVLAVMEKQKISKKALHKIVPNVPYHLFLKWLRGERMPDNENKSIIESFLFNLSEQ